MRSAGTGAAQASIRTTRLPSGTGPPDSAGAQLVPFAKAYSGLTDAEIRRVDAVVRRTTVEKFGPVRSVTPSLVFEIGFEAIQVSTRHRSGVAVRFPRILRWREDKGPPDADTLQVLRSLSGA
jgi:DNA ligase 1